MINLNYEAFAKLKKEYLKHDKKNRKALENSEFRKEGYHLTVQMHVKGRGDGVFYMQFSENDVVIEPFSFREMQKL